MKKWISKKKEATGAMGYLFMFMTVLVLVIITLYMAQVSVKPQIISGDFRRLFKTEIPVTVCGQ